MFAIGLECGPCLKRQIVHLVPKLHQKLYGTSYIYKTGGWRGNSSWGLPSKRVIFDDEIVSHGYHYAHWWSLPANAGLADNRSKRIGATRVRIDHQENRSTSIQQLQEDGLSVSHQGAVKCRCFLNLHPRRGTIDCAILSIMTSLLSEMPSLGGLLTIAGLGVSLVCSTQ